MPESNYFIKATGQLALDYPFLASANIVPYRWTVDAIEANKALFVLDDSGKSTGQTRPFYHATAFERQLPTERVFAAGDLDAQGQGVGVLAGTSAQRVGVLIWNYQFYDQGDRTFNLDLKSLPPELAGGRIRLTVRAIRRTQSQGDPLFERDESLSAQGSHSLMLNLKAN